MGIKWSSSISVSSSSRFPARQPVSIEEAGVLFEGCASEGWRVAHSEVNKRQGARKNGGRE